MEIFFGKVSWNRTVFENFQSSNWLIQWSHDLKWDFERFQAYLKLLEVMALYRTLQKFENRHNLKLLIPYLKLFLFETFLFEQTTHLVFGFHRGRMCIFGDLDNIWNFLIPYLKVLLFETFLIWNFLLKHSTLKWNFLIFYLKLFLNETFSYIKWHFCEITNYKY